MIYPALTFLTSTREAGILAFHDGKVYGPYAVGGWENNASISQLRPEQFMFSYCAFKDGTLPISIDEHDCRLRAGEDMKKGVCNMFISGFFYTLATLVSDGCPIIIEKAAIDPAGRIVLYKYFHNKADEAWSLAADCTMERVEETLGCTFEG